MSELRGHTLHATSPQGRFTEGAAIVSGGRLTETEAYGKHLFLHLSTDRSVHVHLGMQGKWLRYPEPSATPMKQVRLRVATDKVAWDLVAPSKCEVLDSTEVVDVISHLGPDPLRPDADVARAVQGLRHARGPIGAALLDQAVISGVGNVFRNEALHAVGVAPAREAATMTESELNALWVVLRGMMCRAVEDGRIITVDGPDRLSLPESETRKVYKQERCRDCGTPIVTSRVGGRTAYHCPAEQRP